jgi:lysophospholipase
MANKRLVSAVGVAEDQLKAGAKKLQEQLVTVEKAVERLATKAKERLPAAADVKAEIPEVRRRVQQAAASMTNRRSGGPRPVAAATTAAEPTSTTSSTPDDSWSVADLRAEAKRRGMTGYSRKTKAELLADLHG